MKTFRLRNVLVNEQQAIEEVHLPEMPQAGDHVIAGVRYEVLGLEYTSNSPISVLRVTPATKP